MVLPEYQSTTCPDYLKRVFASAEVLQRNIDCYDGVTGITEQIRPATALNKSATLHIAYGETEWFSIDTRGELDVSEYSRAKFDNFQKQVKALTQYCDAHNQLVGGLLKQQITSWQELQLATNTWPKFNIGFIGDTRSGKSTCINAVLGCSLLAGANQGGPVTACITKIRSDRSTEFTVTIKYCSLADVLSEMALVKPKLRKTSSNTVDDWDFELTTASNVSDVAHQVQQQILNERVHLLMKSDNTALKPEIEEELKKKRVVFKTKTMEELAAFVKQYTVVGSNKKLPYWAFVKNVKITGPFSTIPFVCQLIDMPGLNDANKIREQRTLKYVSKCSHICLVMNGEQNIGTESSINNMIESLTKLIEKQTESNLMITITYVTTKL